MHEVSLMYSLLEMLEESAAANQVSKIKRVRLVIGQWHGALPEALAFAFAQLRQGTLCDGAQLEIQEASGQELYVDFYEGE